MEHLWQVDHPYYCADGCYYTSDAKAHTTHDGWASFLKEFKDADVNLNLVWRWDWRIDEEDGSHSLAIFMMHQRKAQPHSHQIENVRPEDEPSVRAFLDKHWRTIQAIWAPLTVDVDGSIAKEAAAQWRAERIAALEAELATLRA